MNNTNGSIVALFFICIYILLCILVGIRANKRKFGFFGGFIISLILTPIIGYIITLFTKSLEQEKREQEILENQKEQTRLLTEKSDNSTSITDELEKLSNLKEKGIITDAEFIQAKQRLIENN